MTLGSGGWSSPVVTTTPPRYGTEVEMDNTLVVGVDGSQPSRAALQWAARCAERSGRRLVVVHVVDGAAERSTTGHPDLRGEELLTTERLSAAAVAPHTEIETALTVGDPVWAISRTYPDVGAIVVGSHKTGFLRGSSFGSRSLQLVAASMSPVIVVPAVPESTARGVVVGLDDSPDGRAALVFAAREAHDLGDELVIVRSIPVARGEHLRDADRERDRAVASLEAARRRAESMYPGLTIRSRVVHGPAAPALVRASARAALLVVGRSQAVSAPAAVGRVTHDVLLNIGVPTAVVSDGVTALTSGPVPTRPESRRSPAR
ncbi:universal stress protein [Labedella populi]|uniref:Universal stress protein n=1 Tax=Labedella populi TaxID=2498850 RepID=A0A3S4A312_9MICO|nr:universal stress protein [Labedella populi]RWZ59203.1 universal stress protein [Labedella populi]